MRAAAPFPRRTTSSKRAAISGLFSPISSWYNGADLIEEGDTMPESGIALAAKYNATYTLEIYKEGEAEGEYPAEPETSTGKGLYLEAIDLGTTLTLPEGYEIDEEQENTLTAASLGKNAVFTVYLARRVYSVRFFADLPEGEEGTLDREVMNVRHGMKVAAPEGRLFGAPAELRLLGWATEQGGEAAYEAGDEIAVTGPLTFYGVWLEGLTDLFGGSDIVFLMEDAAGTKVLMERAGVEFEGTLADDIFTVAIGEANVKGKLTGDGEFALYDAEMNGLKLSNYYTYYDPETNTIVDDVDDRTTIEFDGYFGATLTLPPEEGETQPTKIVGTYYFDFYENCYCLLTDDVEGSLYFSIVSDDESENEEQWFFFDSGETGVYDELILFGGPGYGFRMENSLELDGVTTAVLTYNGETMEGVYTIVSGEYEYGYYIIAMTFYDEYIDYAYIDLNDACFVIYDVNTVGTYEGTFKTAAGEEQATLDLDGFGLFIDSAILYIGDEIYDRGTYYVEESITQGGFEIVVEFEDLGETRFFLGVDETDMSFITLDTGYSEMYILALDDNGLYSLFTPIIVIYEKAAAGHAGSKYAEIWEYNEEDKIVCAAEGYVTEELYGEETLYTFTRTALKEGFTDAQVFESVTFMRSYSVLVYAHAIYTAYTEDGNELYDTFTSEEDGSLAILVGDEERGSFYTPDPYAPLAADGYWKNKDGAIITGMFYTNTYFTHSSDDYGYIAEHETRTYFSFETDEYDEIGLPITYYFGYTYDETKHTGEFHLLDFEPYAFDYVSYETMLLDGEGGVTFLVTEFDEETFDTTITAVKGTYVLKDETVFGDPIYELTLETAAPGEKGITFKTMEFVLNIELIYDENMYGLVDCSTFCPKISDSMVLLDKNGNTMTLDGFAFRACYSDGEGNDAMGYSPRKYDETLWDYLDTTFEFNVGASISEFAALTFTFDIYEDGTFAIRDGLDGEYEIGYDTGESLDAYLKLDGHGNATVTQFDYETYENVTVAQGTYELLTDTILVTLEGYDPFEAYLYEADYSLRCCVQSDENACVYTGADGSVLNILGNKLAYFTEADGYSYFVSYYTFLSENVVSLAILDEYGMEGEIVFLLDLGNKTFSFPVGVKAAQCGTFLSADLGWFILSEDSIIINGQEYVYTVEGTNLVIFADEAITIAIPTGESFVFQGVTYYKWNGEALTFKGTGDYANVTMTFTPAPIEGSMFYDAVLTFEDESKNRTYYIDVSYQSWDGSMSYIIQSYEDYSVYQKIELDGRGQHLHRSSL